MPRFLPLTAYIADTNAVRKISDIVTPPFDDLHMALRQERASKNVNNFVRFESFRELPGDESDDDPIERSKNALKKLIDEKILKIEEPVFYLLELTSGHNRVSGYLGMLELNGSSKPALFESPVDSAVEDRQRQLRSLHLQTAPVTVGYRINNEGAEQLDDVSARIKKQKPFFHFESQPGVHTSIWKVPQHEEIEPILSKKKMVLLDGTARYLAAMENCRRMREKDAAMSPFKSYNFIFTWMIDLDRSPITYRSRHWALKSGSVPKLDGQNLLIKLEDHFEIDRYKFMKPGAKEAELVNLLDEMEFIGKLNHTYGLYVGDKAYYLMYLKNAESYERLIKVKQTRRWKRLDYSILNSIVYDQLLGISWDKQENLEKFTMSVSPQRAVALVDEGFCDAAFILNDPLPEHLIEIAESGETIPARCVYLDPKPCVGPILAPISADFSVGDDIVVKPSRPQKQKK